MTAYVAAPDNSCKGVIHGLDAGSTLTKLLAHLLIRTQEVKIPYARMVGKSQSAINTLHSRTRLSADMFTTTMARRVAPSAYHHGNKEKSTLYLGFLDMEKSL